MAFIVLACDLRRGALSEPKYLLLVDPFIYARAFAECELLRQRGRDLYPKTTPLKSRGMKRNQSLNESHQDILEPRKIQDAEAFWGVKRCQNFDREQVIAASGASSKILTAVRQNQ